MRNPNKAHPPHTLSGARRKAPRGVEGGFTLVEIMVVISIIGLLAAIVGWNVMGQKVKASQAKVRIDCDAISKAIMAYKLDTNQYPNSLEDLVQSSVEGWDGPYIDGGMKRLRDPWKRTYVYELVGSGDPPYRIGSYGMDGVPQGDKENKDIFPGDDR